MFPETVYAITETRKEAAMGVIGKMAPKFSEAQLIDLWSELGMAGAGAAFGQDLTGTKLNVVLTDLQIVAMAAALASAVEAGMVTVPNENMDELGYITENGVVDRIPF